jgi:hypothetical protein
MSIARTRWPSGSLGGRRAYADGTKVAGSRGSGCHLWSAARHDGSYETKFHQYPGPRGAPINQFLHVGAFPPASFKQVVRVNVDTLYSSAFLDLADEPLALSVPETHGRYYLLPLFDAWTNVFATPGTRTTGSAAGTFLIAGPHWNGSAPSRMQVLRSPTDMAWLLGRTQTNGNAFWSVSLYGPDSFFVENPFNRYASAALNLQHGADRSLDIYVQRDFPGRTRSRIGYRLPKGISISRCGCTGPRTNQYRSSMAAGSLQA